MRLSLVLAGVVAVGCGGKKADPEEERAKAEKKAVQEGAATFFAVMREVHAGMPAATALAELPCPPEVVKHADGASISLWIVDRDLVEMFATDGASWKKRGIEPAQVRRATESTFSDPLFDEFRQKWFGGPERREAMSQLDGAATIVTVQPDGSKFIRPHFAVAVPVTHELAKLAGEGTFTAGKVDAWIAIWDTKLKKHVCATRVTAKSTEAITYRERDNPQGYLDGDLESNFYDAAQAGLEKIAAGAKIYESQRNAYHNH